MTKHTLLELSLLDFVENCLHFLLSPVNLHLEVWTVCRAGLLPRCSVLQFWHQCTSKITILGQVVWLLKILKITFLCRSLQISIAISCGETMVAYNSVIIDNSVGTTRRCYLAPPPNMVNWCLNWRTLPPSLGTG